jgi:hypothetical protein
VAQAPKAEVKRARSRVVELALSVGTPRAELAAAKDEADGAIAELGERQRRRKALKVNARGFVQARHDVAATDGVRDGSSN